MAKPVTRFVCSGCGTVTQKWAGRCEACGEWNSISEETPLSQGPSSRGLGAPKGKRMGLTDLRTQKAPPPRRSCGLADLDRVLRGGRAPASKPKSLERLSKVWSTVCASTATRPPCSRDARRRIDRLGHLHHHTRIKPRALIPAVFSVEKEQSNAPSARHALTIAKPTFPGLRETTAARQKRNGPPRRTARS
jgi:hypothetical protein